jgi:hypothetical protein
MATNLRYSPYIPLQRNFPVENVQELGIELDKSYIEIAYRLNQKTIGLFAVNSPQVTGETWYLQGQKRQQTIRQVYTFNSSGSIPHGINTQQIAQFTKCSGEFTDGINFYGAIFGSNVAISGQISFYITPSPGGNIVILSGSGAPAIISGIIILEWLTTVSTNS